MEQVAFLLVKVFVYLFLVSVALSCFWIPWATPVGKLDEKFSSLPSYRAKFLGFPSLILKVMSFLSIYLIDKTTHIIYPALPMTWNVLAEKEFQWHFVPLNCSPRPPHPLLPPSGRADSPHNLRTRHLRISYLTFGEMTAAWKTKLLVSKT